MKISPRKLPLFNYYCIITGLSNAVILFSCSPKQAVSGAKSINSEHLAQGKIIFENSCGKCHDIPNPADHNAQDWVGIMNAMAPKAKLNEEQHQLVYKYIVSAK